MDALRYAADELEYMHQALKRAMSEVHDVRRTLPMYGVGASAVKGYMDWVVVQGNFLSDRVNSMGKAMNRCADTYERYERSITENAPAF